MKEKISVITDGTYGDVLPYIFLAKDLKDRGYNVSVLTSDYYKKICQDIGVNHIGTTTSDLREKFLTNSHLWSPRSALEYSIKYAESIFEESVDKILQETSTSDLIISHSLTIAGKTASKIHKKKYINIALAPICVKSEHRLPIFFGGRNFNFLPKTIKKYFYDFGYFFVMKKYFKKTLSQLKNMGIDNIKDPLFWGVSSELTIGLWPEWYSNVEEDQKKFLRLSGFTKKVEYSEETKEDGLNRWIKKRDTIVITMGSGYLFIKKWKEIIEEISSKYNCNCLVLTPEEIISTDENIKYVKKVHLSKILPLCKICIHHGGAGMVTQTISSGIPSIIIPMGHDQPDNGFLVERLGVGKVIWMREPNQTLILKTLKKVLSSQKIQEKSKKYSDLVRLSEDGITKAGNFVEEFIREN